MIVLLVEGSTEKALTNKIKEFLDERALVHRRSKVALRPKPLMSIREEELAKRIRLELQNPRVAAVVGLIDVFPNFRSAEEAKQFLQRAAERAGVAERFDAHAAQYDVEAWLLPYWDDICRRIGVQQRRPGHNPELVDETNPPSYRLKELYQRAKNPARKYVKTIEMPEILKDKDLTVSANACPEFKSLLNTLLRAGGLPLLP
jgi:hypothetical protein